MHTGTKTEPEDLQWLRTGEAVGKHFGFRASTVSRQSHRCLERFGVCLRRDQGEWCLDGDTTLLQM